jgi:tRNA pseudouridine32 synthase/23S rRNA pseudouridine746 synthase
MFNILSNIDQFEIPKKLQFPHFYYPHPIAIHASNLLKNDIPKLIPNYKFGVDDDESVGKMFGVLVVENQSKEIGYIQAFSGGIPNSKDIVGFVPAVFDLMQNDGDYKKDEIIISRMSKEIEVLESDVEYLELLELKKILERKANDKLLQCKKENKLAKAQRKEERGAAKDMEVEAKEKLFHELSVKSQKDNFKLRDLKREIAEEMEVVDSQIRDKESIIIELKEKRKNKSSAVQNWIFEQYRFKNILNESKHLLDIFKDTPLLYPPSGAGDCAAPRLFNYAFLNHLKPIALAEFWYGESSAGLIRKDGKFYPACIGKCQPILEFQLKGLDVETSLLLEGSKKEYQLETLYEDEHLIIVNKPYGVLSVPGRQVTESIYTRLLKDYPDLIVVHRLDMSTSGILLFAKTAKAHRMIQFLFSERKISKQYEALLDGSPEKKTGTIDLALSQSYLNRPMQIYNAHGKEAITDYEVIETKDNVTSIIFKPHTGRTHQLRMHAAHKNGLNCSIKGDLLYGKPADRMYLHASKLEFTHPISKKIVSIDCPSYFF